MQTVRLILLVAAVAVVTVTIPPLIAPDGHGPLAGGPVLTASPVESLARPAPTAGTTTPPPPRPTRPAPAPPGCAPPVEPAARPSCGVYTDAPGTGWTIEGTGVRVVPAGVVPGTDELAIRVEPLPDSPLTAVALVADTPVRATQLVRLRVFGGRVHGTVLRLSVSPSGRATREPAITLTAPVDRWTTFTVRLAELLAPGAPVHRIDLVVATELVPNAYRFFVDDVALLDR